jgi:hypothetical protein
MQSPMPVLTPGSIFFSSVAMSGPGLKGREVDVWHANHFLPALRAAVPDAALLRFASPARGTFTSIVELPPGDTAKAAALRAVASTQEMAAEVTAIEQFVAEPISMRKRADAGDWSALMSGAPVVYAIFFSVPAAREVEFNRWYEEEHIDMLLDCSDWVACRRFRLVTPHPTGKTHLALHYITDLSALESPQRDIAIRTPWRDRLVAEGWFIGEYRVCHRLV